MKTCTKCKIEKPLSDFVESKKAVSGILSRCKVCAKETNSAYQLKNKERISARKRSFRESNSEKISARDAAYRELRRKELAEYQRKYRKENQEKVASYFKCWASENHGKIISNVRNRRALKANAAGSHTIQEIMSIFERQQGLCANCQARLFKSGKQKYHVDHIMPLVLGGSNWASNLQCLCPTCNLRKSAKDPISWAQENGRLI